MPMDETDSGKLNDYYSIPFNPGRVENVEQAKVNALNYIAAHMGKISAGLVEVKDRLERIEKIIEDGQKVP